jgi:hypothetical protein
LKSSFNSSKIIGKKEPATNYLAVTENFYLICYIPRTHIQGSLERKEKKPILSFKAPTENGSKSG